MSWMRAGLVGCALVGVLCVDGDAAEVLFVAKPLTPAKSFTGGIEGPATDAKGNIYAVNFARQGTVGRTTPGGKSSVYLSLPNGSIGNGIRFGRDGTMYIADYTNHNVLR
ncbi:MAG TPA: SMP-30/gluconolactonase/LRE family protein, partial [Armatimonadota bacterium]|nr:SMP-30/gluconolactonase/LRE family protein [Armatimonadota bacterium]